MNPVFLSHGAPSLLLDGGPGAEFLKGLGPKLGKPNAVLCMSAHWETQEPTFTSSAHPETIHDFYGFPEEMYRMRYPVRGETILAEQALELCRSAGISAALNPERGLDHGAWVPLMAVFPAADIPVVQVSIPFAQGPRGVFAVGAALRPMLREGVLFMGSGGFTHNLGALSRTGAKTPDWARKFRDWAVEALVHNRLEDLLEAPMRAPNFKEAHPRAEHWLPLYFALGAAGTPWRCETLHQGFEFGALAMESFSFPRA